MNPLLRQAGALAALTLLAACATPEKPAVLTAPPAATPEPAAPPVVAPVIVARPAGPIAGFSASPAAL